jgi:hypothetical protein
MRKLLLLLVFALPAWGFSQTVFSFVMTDSVYYGQADPSTIHILDGKVKNLTSDSLNFAWRVDSADMPGDWDIQICDKNVCYAPGVTTANFFLLGDEEGIMKPNIRAVTAYDGKLWLTIYNLEDTTQRRQWEIQVNTLSSSVDPLLEAGVSMSPNAPNPFSAETMIDLDLKGRVGELKITDLSGRELKVLPLSAPQTSVRLQVESLSSGLYFYTLWMEGRPVISHKMQVLAH